jgi:DNA-binding IclR family transcriptional regulator
MGVTPGYKIDRDEHGLTHNEREVLKGMLQGKTLTAVGVEMDLSRQRTAKLASDLVEKGWLIRGEKRGQYAVDTKKIAVIQTW